MDPIRIFISYARRDNTLPRNTDGQGFVTALEEQLNYEFDQYGPSGPELWWDRNQIEDGDPFPTKLEDAINSSDLLLIVLSHNWLSRPFCQQEFALFQKRWAAEGPNIERRIKVVHKSFVEETKRPQLLQKQSGYAFFGFDGRKREETRERPFFDRGKPVGGEYTAQIRELGGHLWRAAKRMADRGATVGQDGDERSRGNMPAPITISVPEPIIVRPRAPRNGRTIFLAKPAPDMQPAYRRVARELDEDGYTVVPNVNEDLPVGEKLQGLIDDALAKAEACVHLLGERSQSAELAQAGALVGLQLARAAVRAEAKPQDGAPRFLRYIWAPKILEDVQTAEDTPHRDPDAVVASFGPQLAADKLFSDNSSRFVAYVLKSLQDNAPRTPAEIGELKKGQPVYFYYRDIDRQYAKSVAKTLSASKGILPRMSISDGTEQELLELHRKRLLECDSVVLCWASASEAWVMSRANELKDWRALGRSKQFARRGLVIGPPPRDFKAEYFELPSDEVDVALDLTGSDTPSADALERLLPPSSSKAP